MSALSSEELREARLRAFENGHVQGEEEDELSADDSSSQGGQNSSLSSNLTGGLAGTSSHLDDTDDGSELSLDFESLSVNSEDSSDLESVKHFAAGMKTTESIANAGAVTAAAGTTSTTAAGANSASSPTGLSRPAATTTTTAAAAARLPAGGLISAALRRSAPPTRQPLLGPNASMLEASRLATAPLGRRKQRRRDNEARLSALAGLPPSMLGGHHGGDMAGSGGGAGGLGMWRQQQALCLAVFPIPESTTNFEKLFEDPHLMHRFASGYCTRSSKKTSSSKRHSGSGRKRAARTRNEQQEETRSNVIGASKSGNNGSDGSHRRDSQVEGDASDTSEGSFAVIGDDESNSEAEIDAGEFGLDL